jgi:hypothetical protein
MAAIAAQVAADAAGAQPNDTDVPSLPL